MQGVSVVSVVDFKSFAPHCCGFKSLQGHWILSFEEAIQQAYGMLVILLMCLLMLDIMNGGLS